KPVTVSRMVICNSKNTIMNRCQTIVAIGLFVFMISGCKEDSEISNAGGPAPKQVTDIRVLNTPGGAEISYNHPKDKQLLYVQAEVESSQGKIRTAKSSFYTNSVHIEGLPDTTEYQVKLYSVGKNNKFSEPIVVTIKPETPPVQAVYRSLAHV